MVNVENKKGWLRVVEASLGVILILGAVLIFYQTNNFTPSDNFGKELPALADELAKNDSMREIIFNLDIRNDFEVKIAELEFSKFLSDKISRSDLNYTVIICKADEFCPISGGVVNPQGDLFSFERIISTNFRNNYDKDKVPIKFKIYFWKI